MMADSALIVYQVHPVTHEYIGSAYADPDPLNSGEWLLPSMAFADEPPKVEKGYAVIYAPGENGIWEVVPDCRGIVYDVNTGSEFDWQDLGKLPSQFTLEKRPSLSHVWSGSGWVNDEVLQKTNEAVAERYWRDLEIERVKWLRERHRDEVELGFHETLSSGEYLQVLEYLQALRQWPQSPDFPRVENRPKSEGWLSGSIQSISV